MLPTSTTIKTLFARSGNRCAFPECYALLVEDNDVVTGEICHIRSRAPTGPRYDARQTNEERNAPANLILLCSRHHKMIDSDPDTYSTDQLCAMKKERETNREITPENSRKAELLRQHVMHVHGDFTVSEIHAASVTFKSAGRRAKARTPPPSDAVGGSSAHRTYLKYLIDRYHKFAEPRLGSEFRYPAVYSAIKREFKTDWEWIPLSRFDEAITFMQAKIDRTRIGRQRKHQGMASYEGFETYVAAHR